ncbi:tyrosine-type recombinase/integrase [Rhizobiaceae bacterium n13]|uniref:Tyrosine-type recombinase/integrase n=1 Tax=Ferirhizobium litorale TaxID=2927786 RepID=A0AAE3QKM3_9HYPH|nr:tyrosine-type recombinase/integrase [Fererhizobium litorale]MDI7863966.1 tyrosine-type recombinase/integrase [Fererhizobium litorale]MDI7925250.1 tyrosine-type recombinase/integrase [Fererhizobium litorale]
MATDPNFPGASSYAKKDGKIRWRYRGKGVGAKEIQLPGLPGDEAFELAYLKAAAPIPQEAEIIALPGRIVPKSFGHAQRILEESPLWLSYDPKTRKYNTRMIETFLNARVDPGYLITWRDTPCAELMAKDIRAFLAPFYREGKASRAKHQLVAIRKLTAIAVEKEWAETDATYGIKAAVPPTDGHAPWSRAARERFEAHHPVGSAARTAYALAMWLGNRRGDIAALTWDSLMVEEVEAADGAIDTVAAFAFRQLKNRNRNGGKEMFLKLTEPLRQALAPLRRDGGTVLKTAYGEAFSAKSLTGCMANWTRQAGLPPGHTLHGLRKSLGIFLAESGASARQIQDVLGHESMKEADTYIRMANRKLTATDALSIIEAKEARRAARPRLSLVR